MKISIPKERIEKNSSTFIRRLLTLPLTFVLWIWLWVISSKENSQVSFEEDLNETQRWFVAKIFKCKGIKLKNIKRLRDIY